jgi:hypothetical protein
MWGFTVDDALIPVRYARHIAAGEGWRFNLGGPASDGVTPLPWPVILAPIAHAPTLDVLLRAKWVNLAAWTLAAAFLSDAIGKANAAAWVRIGALAVVGLSVPVAAGAVSGLETGVATALATGAAIVGARGRPLAAAAFAGAAATLRPEMAVWALVLASALLLAEKGSRPASRLALGAVLALGPFVVCATIRAVAFGRPAPLALLAKPSDLHHGAVYVAAAA